MDDFENEFIFENNDESYKNSLNFKFDFYDENQRYRISWYFLEIQAVVPNLKDSFAFVNIFYKYFLLI